MKWITTAKIWLLVYRPASLTFKYYQYFHFHLLLPQKFYLDFYSIKQSSDSITLGRTGHKLPLDVRIIAISGFLARKNLVNCNANIFWGIIFVLCVATSINGISTICELLFCMAYNILAIMPQNAVFYMRPCKINI